MVEWVSLELHDRRRRIGSNQTNEARDVGEPTCDDRDLTRAHRVTFRGQEDVPRVARHVGREQMQRHRLVARRRMDADLDVVAFELGEHGRSADECAGRARDEGRRYSQDQ